MDRKVAAVLFKRETATCLARYGRELRLRQAKRLLKTTFLKVREIPARYRRVDRKGEVRESANKPSFWLKGTYSSRKHHEPKSLIQL